MKVPDWDRANCRGTDTELFFPISGNQDGPAKRVCSGCRIRESCLNYAIDTGEKFGIWGGMTEQDRTEEIRRRNKAARQSAVVELAQRRFVPVTKLHRSGMPHAAIAEQLRLEVKTVEKYLKLAGVS